NMDQAPFVLPKARYGYRMGMPKADITDAMVYDGLWDIFNDYHMGMTAENVAEKYGVSRDEADEYSARSHRLAAKATQEGAFTEQIVPVSIRQKRETVEFTTDEHVRPTTTPETLAKLPPVFKKDGSVTVAVARELGIPEEKLNPVGGAVALGHPIGASGAVLTVKLLHELARRKAHYGLATLCIGGGMGIAAIFERV